MKTYFSNNIPPLILWDILDYQKAKNKNSSKQKNYSKVHSLGKENRMLQEMMSKAIAKKLVDAISIHSFSPQELRGSINDS